MKNYFKGSIGVTARQFNLWIHRYVGLGTAVFLLITALTGALLAFEESLDNWFNHKLAYVEPQTSQPLSIAQLHDQVVATFPQKKFSSMPVEIEPNHAVVFNVDRDRSKSTHPTNTPTFQQVFVNPYTGDIIGTRDREQWAWQNTMWKVFWLHRNLLMGDIGQTILGIAGLLWTLNCFVGLYLTLPRARKQAANASLPTRSRSWLQQWLRAWTVRRFSSWFKLNYDLHHALGLWFWLLALPIAWASVGFNLKPVYQPVMALMGAQNAPKPKTDAPRPQQISMTDHTLAINKYQAIDTLTTMAQRQAQADGLHFVRPLGIRWQAEDGAWQLRFKTAEDIGNGRGASSITVNAQTGAVSKTNYGARAAVVNKAEHWWYALHRAHFDNRWYPILLAVFGIATAVMCVTGVYLWWRGRQARQKQRAKQQAKSLQMRA
ncbi:PepSY-associated TM helix domain-containing protein [Moraxella atlantae]|uniref:PepSY-associated TM helix domain-containing protein n=1 Tax=Faucicola atlantae TaxID=34059 RepID=UPI0037520E78